ncbi:MAG TPA: sigma 54-interacting transcriptional regulator [Terriglobia bacterium]|nr:sigma 54-interacting transcriptional regulator [Terriglobia bacterium]
MNPRLIAISGPRKGSTFNLTEAETTIGRDPANRVVVSDQALSRRHCVIKKEGDRLKLVDLESRNGSFVNGVPVRRRWLEHGDQIEIGESVLFFLLREEATAPAPAEEGEEAGSSTLRLRREDLPDLPPQELPERGLSVRNTRDLNTLLKVSAAINTIPKLDDLQRRLLELVFEAIPAEQGAILLARENQEDFASIFGLDRIAGFAVPVHVSREIISKAIGERAPILRQAVSGAGTGEKEGAIASVLAVPLLRFGKAVGALYLETSNGEAPFDRDHLDLLNGVAAAAALALESVRQAEWLESENQWLHAEIKVEHNMVGESRPIREVRQFIAKVGPRDSTVLILGETGTGKELVARALHLNSPRARRPFVAINCAALIETLLESELFGHEKGAFTGAFAQKKGKLEVAEGGTLFLDEVSELTPALQAKLLRVIQEREFERLGGTRTIRADIRLIAATNRNLDKAVRDGTFRQDLYFRLNVVSITTPSLRERSEDIPLLAAYFAAKYSRQCNRRVMGVSSEARACLMRYEWPGNIRELENAIERAVVMGSGGLIRPEDLPADIVDVEAGSARDASVSQYHEVLRETKKRLILQAVEQAGNSYTGAAKLLGVHPNYLHRLIRNLNLKTELKK